MLTRLMDPKAHQVFLGVYNNLLLTAGDSRLKSVLICSSSPGEGSTTTAVGLALAVAMVQNWPVLLIDGNFANPRVCQTLEEPESPGLGEILAGTAAVESVIRSVTTPHWRIIGAGTPPPDHVSVLEPPFLKNLLDGLSADYRLLIIDGPSINMFPESVLYAAQVDRVFLVVHAGVTRVHVVSNALARLHVAGFDPGQVDLILNRRTFPIPGWIYKCL
jgi:capsular exopolysaccharide synthesis family protein